MFRAARASSSGSGNSSLHAVFGFDAILFLFDEVKKEERVNVDLL